MNKRLLIKRNESLPLALMTKWTLLATILFLPIIFCPWSYGGSELPKLLALHTLILITLVILVFTSRNGISISASFLPVLAIFVVTALATVFSALPFISITGTYQRYNGLIQVADMVMLCFLSATVFTPSDTRKIFASATLAGVIVSVYGIAQHFGFEFLGWNISETARNIALKHRSFATLASPSFLGLYLAMLIPLAFSGSVDAHGRVRAFWYVSIGLITICLIFTYSRAAWLGAVGGLIVWLAFFKQKNKGQGLFDWLKNTFQYSKWALSVFILSVIIGVLLAPTGGRPSAIDRALSIADSEVGSTQVRFKLWHSALNMITDRPILGWGSGTFRYILPRYASSGMTEFERQNVSAHNDFLDRASQTGLLSLAIYLWLLVSIVFLRKTSSDRNSIYAITGSLLAYLVAVQFGFSSLTPMAMWWILLGCLLGSHKERNGVTPNKREISLHPPFQKIILSILVLIWGFLTIWTASWLIADIHFRNAKIALEKGDKPKAIAEAENAVKWNPKQDFYLAWLGQVYHKQGKNAFNFCSKAVHINPLNPSNRALMAEAYQLAGQDSSALKEWQNAVELDPQWLQAYNELGMMYHKLDDVGSAINSYLIAIEIDPNYAPAYNNLGNAYLAKGKTKDAVASYQRALSLKPGWETAKYNLGIALRLRDNSKK
jgi:O-antigen ligase